MKVEERDADIPMLSFWQMHKHCIDEATQMHRHMELSSWLLLFAHLEPVSSVWLRFKSPCHGVTSQW